jgi:hypothetical protein
LALRTLGGVLALHLVDKSIKPTRACAIARLKAAFEKECHLFHDFGETSLDNKIHPARPSGSNWKCPRCRILD